MQCPEEFESTWLDRLSTGARVLFRSGAPSQNSLAYTGIADAFVQSLGLKPIGFNWELLDAGAGAAEPRSGIGEIVNALSHDLSNPNTPWLDPLAARQCGRDFLDLFEPPSVTLVSNRYDGLWNPIAGGEVEWGFVGFDQNRIALLLLVAK